MTTKKATYQYDNGSGWDEIMFKTTADQVVESSTKRFVSDSEKSKWNGKADGNHTHSYLPLSGGTLTGNIKFNMFNRNNTIFNIYNGDANGHHIRFGGGGATIVAAGEAGGSLESIAGTAETLSLAADQAIDFYTNCNTFDNRLKATLDVNLNFFPSTNGTGFIGTSSNKWKGMYANTFYGALSGNASTATTLQNARTLTIGNTGKSFNGSTNITWSLAEIGALALSGGTMTGDIKMTDGKSIRISTTDTNARLGYEASTRDVFLSNAENNWLRLKPDKTMSYAGHKVYTAFDKPTANEVGALALSGGTMSGSIKSSLHTATWLDGNKGKALVSSTNTAGAFTTLLKSNSTNGYFTLNNYNSNLMLVYTDKTTVDAGNNTNTKQATLLDETGNTYFPGRVSASGGFNGNASTASKWQTARTLTLTGGATGSATIDGSGNVSLATTVNWGNISGKPSASTSAQGIVQLNNTVTSTSTTQAATANAVKVAYDKANEAFQYANNGKTSLANVIGSPTTSSNTFAQMATNITNIKNNLVTKIKNYGTTCSANDSLNDLVTKIKNIPSSQAVEITISGNLPVDGYSVSLESFFDIGNVSGCYGYAFGTVITASGSRQTFAITGGSRLKTLKDYYNTTNNKISIKVDESSIYITNGNNSATWIDAEIVFGVSKRYGKNVAFVSSSSMY